MFVLPIRSTTWLPSPITAPRERHISPMKDHATADLIWHYTKAHRMESILHDGVIKVGRLRPKKGPPAVSFSTNQYWERTASGGVEDPAKFGGKRFLSLEETAEIFGGVWRLGVDPSVAPYDCAAMRARMEPYAARYLEQLACQNYAQPREWRGTYDPVPSNLWARVELWRGGQWTTIATAYEMKDPASGLFVPWVSTRIK
jgi:hypothetical protein